MQKLFTCWPGLFVIILTIVQGGALASPQSLRARYLKFDLPDGSYPIASATSDLNGDSWTDFVIGNQGSEDVVVFLNENGLNFHPQHIDIKLRVERFDKERTPDDPWRYITNVLTSDIDKDGDQDIVVTAGSHYVPDQGISILINDGNGSFSFNPRRDNYFIYAPGELESYPSKSVATDLNLDGYPDIVVANSNWYGGKVSVLLNKGDGTFTTDLHFSSGAIDPYSIAAANIDGDRLPDIAVGHGLSGELSLLKNLGNDSNNIWRGLRVVGSPIQTEQFIIQVSFKQIQGLQHPALFVVTPSANQIRAYFNRNGSYSNEDSKSYDVGPHPYEAIVEDFRNDGHIGLATANYNLNGRGDQLSILTNLASLTNQNFYTLPSHEFGKLVSISYGSKMIDSSSLDPDDKEPNPLQAFVLAGWENQSVYLMYGFDKE